MSEYQKMISSQPYNCMAPELDVLRRETARRYRSFNRAEEEEQLALLKQQAFGAPGTDNVVALPAGKAA